MFRLGAVSLWLGSSLFVVDVPPLRLVSCLEHFVLVLFSEADRDADITLLARGALRGFRLQESCPSVRMLHTDG